MFPYWERKRFLFTREVPPERKQHKLIWVGPIWKKKEDRILRLAEGLYFWYLREERWFWEKFHVYEGGRKI